MVMTHTHAKGQRSLGLKVTMEMDRQTYGGDSGCLQLLEILKSPGILLILLEKFILAV